MPIGYASLLILNFILYASSLHLGNRRDSRLSTLPGQIYENSTAAQPGTLEIRLDGSNYVKGSRNNKEPPDVKSSGKTEAFVNCHFTFDGDGGGLPKYACTHSDDVKMEWHEEKGQMKGIFTSVNCSGKRCLNDEMESGRDNVVRKLGQSIRRKRQTMYRDDAGDEESEEGDAEQTDEGGSIPLPDSEDDVENNVEGTLEESQVIQSPDVEEEITDEDDKEHPVDDEGRDESEKEVNGGSKGRSGVSDEGEEVPGEKNSFRSGEEKGDNEDASRTAGESTDTELPLQDEEDEDKKEGNDETTQAEEKVDKEEVAEEETKDEEKEVTDANVGENGDKPTSDNDKPTSDNDKPKSDNDNPASDNDKPTSDNDKSKPDNDKPKPDSSKPKTLINAGNIGDYDLNEIAEWIGNITWNDIDMDFEIGLEMIITPNEIIKFLGDITEMFLAAGDYILSLLLKNLKKSLQKSHMDEKFNAKVEALAKARDGDTEKALRAIKNVIQRQFGTSFELELVKYLKKLRENFKL